ncbi:MAG: hypothetical protein ACJATI_000946 [Halioglobus sp.]|jgi:hypothetical protein
MFMSLFGFLEKIEDMILNILESNSKQAFNEKADSNNYRE